MSNTNTSKKSIDVCLIGAGIMSATLAMLLKQLDPAITIELHEMLGSSAEESSNAWNNAGTGHAALCEMNYTPEEEDGTINITKALELNTEFDCSRQFWSWLVKKGVIRDPQSFIHAVPHCSLVQGADNRNFLRKRFETLSAHPLYKGMEYTENRNELANWLPLVMEGRDPGEIITATRMQTGTDVDYGALTRIFIDALQKMEGFSIHYNSRVNHLKREQDNWKVVTNDEQTDEYGEAYANFVFIGAGGGSLRLLQKSEIPEADGYAGFPVSGIWLRCDNPVITNRHNAKVYGKAEKGAPPISVPHLDTRHIEGKVSLLFGPYAGFSTKYLKHGSKLDLFSTIDLHNLLPMLAVARDNLQFEKYLLGQLLQSDEKRFEALQEFFPLANPEDWQEETAGQRVQIIKKDIEHSGILQFGTELVSSSDHTLTALLGASPGASTAVSIMIEVVEQHFAGQMQNKSWRTKLKEIIPSYGESLIENPALCETIREATAETLNLKKTGDGRPTTV